MFMTGRKGTALMAAVMGAGLLFTPGMTRAEPATGKPVFTSGRDGYHTYRIPALAVTNRGTVLAFCEGRRHGRGDSGDIDLLVKRSTDNGTTWSRQQVIRNDAANTCGNPCVVVDRQTGVIWLLSTWNRGDDSEGRIINRTSHDTRRVFVLYSTDDGLTWSKPRPITDEVKRPQWTWYATGPGSGIQIRQGPHKGRLIIPCDHIEARTKHYYSHVIYSDDHGKTWRLGGSSTRPGTNECQVVELTGGRLMLNMRNYDRAQKTRQVAISEDGGLTWKNQHFDPALVEPICQAAIERYAATAPLAAALAPCWSAEGDERVDVGCVLQRAGDTTAQIRGAMEIRSGGEQGFHKPFADMVRVGVVRAGVRAAAAAGEDRSMGILRLNMLDFCVDSSADPVILLSIAAWDAGNRNALRATELLHAQVGHLPGVEIARYPLDALQVRLGRESAPGLPMH